MSKNIKVEEKIKDFWLDGFCGSSKEVLKFIDEMRDVIVKAQDLYDWVYVETVKGKYISVNGWRDKNEEELREETNIIDKELRFWYTQFYSPEDGDYGNIGFFKNLLKAKEICLNETEETEAIIWKKVNDKLWHGHILEEGEDEIDYRRNYFIVSEITVK